MTTTPTLSATISLPHLSSALSPPGCVGGTPRRCVRFLLDAQLPSRLARQLASGGHDVVHTSGLPDGNRTSDAEIARRTDAEDRVVHAAATMAAATGAAVKEIMYRIGSLVTAGGPPLPGPERPPELAIATGIDELIRHEPAAIPLESPDR